MKTNAIVRIVLFSLAILILAGILVSVIALRLFMVNFDSKQLWNVALDEDVDIISSSGTGKSGTYSAEEIRDIEINWAAGSITIQPGDTNAIQFEESAVTEEKYQMIYKRSGDKLIIDFNKSSTLGFGISISGIPSKDLVITVPRDWVCDSLEIDTASARVEVTDLTINEVDFDGASGICIFENCQVDEIDLDTASGDVEFFGTLNVLECDAASANCSIEVTNVPSRIDIDSASGDLDLTLPEDCGFSCSLDSLSGSFSSDFTTSISGDSYTYGDGHCRIQVNAMSGDVIIRKGNSAPTSTLPDCTEPDCTVPEHEHSGGHF